MTTTPRQKLARRLLNVRPAPLAAALKFIFRIKRETVETDAGRFWADPASSFGAGLIGSGAYEPEMRAVLLRHLQAGDTFVDLGANEGYFSVIAARIVGASGKVISIEPQERLLPVLARNFELNGIRHALVVNRAISDHPGTAQLHITSNTNTGSTSLIRPTRYKLPCQTVALTTLEQLFDEQGITECRLLKIDIEGWEHEAILGSPALFRSGRVRALVLELHGYILERRGLNPRAIPDFLLSCGYRLNPDDGIEWTAPVR